MQAWFDEAVSRILEMGNAAILQHPLDSCLFLAYGRPIQLGADDQDDPKLLATFGIHVDDLFGAYNHEDAETMKIIDNLQKIFKFGEWHSGAEKDELTYCGAQIFKQAEGHWKIHQGDYFKRQKPITIAKDRLNKDIPVTEKERTALRGLLGALAWPFTQTAPHLQSTTSLLAGKVTRATTKRQSAAKANMQMWAWSIDTLAPTMRSPLRPSLMPALVAHLTVPVRVASCC